MKKDSERQIQTLLESERDNVAEIEFSRNRNEKSRKKVTQASNETQAFRNTLTRVQKVIKHKKMTNKKTCKKHHYFTGVNERK